MTTPEIPCAQPAQEPVAVVESIGPVPGKKFSQPQLLWYVDFPNMAAMVKPGDKLYTRPSAPCAAVKADPVATLRVSMERHDMGQSLAPPPPPFRFAQAFAHKVAENLPNGDHPLYATPPDHTAAMTAAAQAIESLLSLIRRNAPELSGKVIGWAERDVAALRAIVGSHVPVQGSQP